MRKLILYLLIFVCSGFQVLVSQTVTGTVTSAQDGTTLPGVTVAVKGKTIGTTTNSNGTYSITVETDVDILVFSFVGMKALEVPVEGRSTIDVVMEQSILGIDDVIVVAYGTATKATYTGSAAVVGTEKLEKLQVTSIAQALQGNSTGIEVKNTTGQPGESPDVRIRGISSINGSSSPLYVVDGAPYGGNIGSIDPNDVESITVLKDAVATALYGSRASAGVIMITTKKGKGKAKVEFQTSVGMNDLATPIYPQTSNRDFYILAWEALRNGYLDGNPAGTQADAMQYATNNLLVRARYNAFDKFPILPDGSFDESANPLWETTWADVIFKPGPRQEHHLSMSGSTDDGTSYYLAFGFMQDKGTMTNADYKRYSGRANISKQVTNWFETGLNVSFNRGVQDSPVGVRQYRYSLDLSNIYTPWVWDDASGDWLLDEEGKRIFDMGAGQYNGLSRATWVNTNPLAEAEYSQNLHEYDNLNTRAFVNLTILPGLDLRNSLAVDYNSSADYVFWHGVWSWANNQGGTSSRTRGAGLTYTLTNLISYNKNFNKHNIDILAGHEAYSYKYNNTSASGSTFPVNSLVEVGATSVMNSVNSNEDNHRIESYLTSAKYNYDQKYYFSASFRRDGTSRFHPDSRWGNFWSVGASWRLSEETFLDSQSWIDNLTLRASYGSQGNERISNYYAYLGLYNTTKENSTPAFILSSLSNPTLKWENNRQANIGFDLSMMERFRISAEFFIRDSQDLLFNREMPLSTGLGSIAENIGDIRNTGFEVQLYSLNILTSDFRWETELNLTSYKNEITSLPNEEISAGLHRYVVGKSVYDFYLKDFAGVESTTGKAQYYKNIIELDGLGNPVLDENGKEIVTGKELTTNYNEASYYYLGSALPKLYGNIVNDFYYKGFDLSFNFLFSIGGKIYDNGLIRMAHYGVNAGKAFYADMVNRWTPENTDTDIPRVTSHGPTGNMFSGSSSQYLIDGTYARLRNLTLGYTLPEHVTSSVGLSRVRVYLKADNYLTLYKYRKRGTDPELGFNGAIDVNSVTVPRIISGGLQVSF